MHGGKKSDPRWGLLSPWGARQIDQRLRDIHGEGGTALLVGGRGWKSYDNARAAISVSLITTLRRAGLGDELGVRPASIALWAGAVALKGGATIDSVARMLGARSLDQVAEILGYDWREVTPS